MDKLDFLDGQTPAETPAVTPEPQAQAEPTQTVETAPEGPVRDDKGRFAAKTTETTAAPAQAEPDPSQAPAILPEATPPQTPPIDPVVAELQKQVEGLKKALSATRQQTRQAEPAPDPYEDFEAYQAWQETQVAGERFEWSRQLLAVKHGQETAEKVQQWAAEKAETDPLFYQRAMSARDPFGFAYEEFQQAEALTLLTDPAIRDRFKAFVSGQHQPQAAPQAAPQSPAAPPPSITSAPSAGGVAHTPVGPGTAYGALFG